MNKHFILSAILVPLSVVGSLAFAQAADKLQPKLTVAQAQEKIQAIIKGDVLKSELDYEESRPVYNFIVKTAEGSVLDIEIDGITGKVVETKDKGNITAAQAMEKDEGEKDDAGDDESEDDDEDENEKD